MILSGIMEYIVSANFHRHVSFEFYIVYLSPCRVYAVYMKVANMSGLSTSTIKFRRIV